MTTSDPGRFVWYDLLTSDPTAAIAFYGDVVGWKTEPFGDGGYQMFVGPQGPLGGVMRLPDQAKAMGAPPMWQANVEVADLDASVAKVKELGGKIHVQDEVPTVGRFAIIQDPQGASLALFQPSRDMASHDVSKHGEFSWHELYTSDHTAAFAFYSAIAGWEKLGSFEMGPMGEYLLWGRGGTQLGGMMTMKTQPPSWMYYVTVEDFDAAHERAKAGGAKVLNGPMEVPGGQRIVQMLDPQGAGFALASQPKPA